MKQQIQLRRREVDESVELPADLSPLLRRLYASRGVRSAQDLERSVKGMLPWQQLSGVEKAVEILYNAFREDAHHCCRRFRCGWGDQYRPERAGYARSGLR